MSRVHKQLIWGAVAIAVVVPIAVAAFSPLLAWREPVYIIAGFAGVVAMSLLLMQPLLAGGYLPGLSFLRARKVHRWLGSALVAAVIVHVVGLWITSPPDVVDALFFVSPTPFSAWGVIAMWAVFGAAVLAAIRRRLQFRLWQVGHTTFVAVTVVGSVVHAALIEGTMGTMSKAGLCALVLVATASAISDQRRRARRNSRDG